MERLFTEMLGRYDCLFVAPHGDDVMLGCPARVFSESERGRRVLVLALFDRGGAETRAAEAATLLGADYVAGGLAPAAERRTLDVAPRLGDLAPEDELTSLEAARLLADTGPRTQAVHVYAPLGLGGAADHLIAYEATIRAFASEPGRNLFLYEERPEAFVPAAVRTRLATLGARLPPGARNTASNASLLRHLWSVNEPRLLRGDTMSFGERSAALWAARRRFREARPWNPLRALGPRLQPVVHQADEEAATKARQAAVMLLQSAWAARRFNARAAAAARRLGGIYHAERLWLFLPSGEGLPETEHPLERPRL